MARSDNTARAAGITAFVLFLAVTIYFGLPQLFPSSSSTERVLLACQETYADRPSEIPACRARLTERLMDDERFQREQRAQRMAGL